MSAASGAKNVFLSYAHENADLAKAVADALSAAGLSVWYDPLIRVGERWDAAIEDAHRAADVVLVLLTDQVGRSDFVYVEASRARMDGRLMALNAAKDLLPMRFEALLGPIQMGVIDAARPLAAQAGFQSVLASLGGGDEHVADELDAAAAVRRWFAAGPNLPDVALAVALAALDGAPIGVVDAAASEIGARLAERFGEASGAAPRFVDRETQFEGVGGRVERVTSRRLGVDLKLARYQDPARGLATLQHSLAASGLSDVVRGWIVDRAQSVGADSERLSLRLGLLMQTEFLDIHNAVVAPLLGDKTSPGFDFADRCLVVAAADPVAHGAIEKLMAGWSATNGSGAQLTALELAFGLIGARYPEVAVRRLRDYLRVDKTQETARIRDVNEVLGRRLQAMVDRAAAGGDDSLWDGAALLNALADWTLDAEPGLDLRAASAVLIAVLTRVPLTDADGSGGASLEQALTRDASRRPVLAPALRRAIFDRDSRDDARTALKAWVDRSHAVGSDPNPAAGARAVETLAMRLASDEADQFQRDKILHVFRSGLSADAQASLAHGA